MTTAPPPTPAATAAAPALDDADLARLEELLLGLGERVQPMALSALDGYLCGVLLQAKPVPFAAWWPHVLDAQGKLPNTPAAQASLPELQALVQRRHSELDIAITQRQWFDPWVFADDGDDDNNTNGPTDQDPEGDADEDSAQGAGSEAMLLWVAGFAAAMEHFPQLMDSDDPDLVEPLAVLFLHFDPADLEDADDLLAMIETLEPPPDLEQAVQDAVRAVMLIADVTRPLRAPAKPPAARKRAGLAPRTGAANNRAAPAKPRTTRRPR